MLTTRNKCLQTCLHRSEARKAISPPPKTHRIEALALQGECAWVVVVLPVHQQNWTSGLVGVHEWAHFCIDFRDLRKKNRGKLAEAHLTLLHRCYN